MIKKSAAFVFLCACSTVWGQTTPIDTTDTFKPLSFLIGTWEAKTQGGSAGATASGTYSFGLELRNHVLARQTNTAGCKGPTDYNCEHSDLLYVYNEPPGRLKAIYFDSEGHVIHYDVSVPTPTAAVFLSDPSYPGPQFRLSYELKGPTMHGKFEVRPPGRVEFRAYLEWNGDKK